MLKLKFEVALCNRVWTTLEINEIAYIHSDESKKILKIAEKLHGIMCNYVANDRLYVYNLTHSNIVSNENRVADQFIEYITNIYNHYKDSPRLCLYKLTNATHYVKGLHASSILSIINTETHEYVGYAMDSAPYTAFRREHL